MCKKQSGKAICNFSKKQLPLKCYKLPRIKFNFYSILTEIFTQNKSKGRPNLSLFFPN